LFESIHADVAAVLPFASLGSTMHFSCAIFGANSICAGLAGLGPDPSAVSPPAISGAYWLRNSRQIDLDFVFMRGGLNPFYRAMLLAKRFIVGGGGRSPGSLATDAPIVDLETQVAIENSADISLAPAPNAPERFDCLMKWRGMAAAFLDRIDAL
jgi:hypothetical protein